MKVVYASRALRDIDDILTYIHERSPQVPHSGAVDHARDLYSFASGQDAIEDCVTLLAERPTIDARLVGFPGRFRIDCAGLHRVLDRQ